MSFEEYPSLLLANDKLQKLELMAPTPQMNDRITLKQMNNQSRYICSYLAIPSNLSFVELSRSYFFFHHYFDVSVVIYFVLLMSLASRVLSSTAGRAVGEINAAIFAVKFGHTIRDRYNYQFIINHTYILQQTLMSLKLQIQKRSLERSPRVKALDFHHENTWIVYGLYSGTLSLHDYSTNTCIRTIEASAYPVRAVRFVIQKQWIVCGSDDFQIRVYNYNTMEKVKEFQAHNDFIRAIIVHPSQPYLITASDEAKVKIWNFDNNFNQVSVLEEHKHFVMALAFNPKDLTKFASGSMDKTIKIWNLKSDGKANLTLSGHKAGVNCLNFHYGDKPHIVSGSDDRTIKIWDYQTKQCLNTIQTHALAVSSVAFHPELPILLSVGQQGKTIIHHTSSWSVLNVLQYNLGMGWTIDSSRENNNIIGIGYDEGSVIVRIGSDEPVVSLSNGKILWAKSMEILAANLKAIDLSQNKSGERISISAKEIGHTEIYPTYIKHSPNGHHFGLCNQTEFAVIKTASFKTVLLGNGTSLVWRNDSDFAVLQNDIINIYSQFQYSSSIKLSFVPKKIYEGQFLTVAGPESLVLYDWEKIQKPIHSLPIIAQKVWWNDEGNMLIVAAAEKLYVYSLNKKTLALIQHIVIQCKATSGTFSGDVFYYSTFNAKIFFVLQGKNFFLQNFEKKKFILGTVESQNRVYFFDRNHNIYSLSIPFDFFSKLSKYIAEGGKGDVVDEVPQQLKDTVTKVLSQFGFHKAAFKLVQNQDMKFEIAIQLGLTREAFKIASSIHSQHKMKQVGDIALKKGDIQMGIECFEAAEDLNSLLLIFSSLSLPDQLKDLAVKAERLTKMNIAYTCYYLTNQPQKCVDVLIKSKKFSEAALFSRTYCPERVQECVRLWRQSIPDKSIANKIADLNQQEEGQEGDEEQQGEQAQAQN